MTTPTPPLKPTVFFFCRLGDMVMLTALLSLLHRRYGAPCQVIGTGSWTASVYEGNPDVQGVWSFHRHLPFLLDPAWLPVRRALKASAPGPIYVCERHYRQLPRIRRMLRLAGVDPRRCVFLQDQATAGPEPLVDRLLRFGSATPAGWRAADYPIIAPASVKGPRLYVLDAERRKVAALARRRGWEGRPLVIIQPGNHRSMGPRRGRWRRLNKDDKAWPLQRWAALAERIQGHLADAVVVFRGSREEVPMLEEIRAAAASAAVEVIGTDLRLLFALSEYAHSMISVDTGPAHAAAALDVPLVVLYGAETSRYWLPRSPGGAPVVGVGGPPIATRADQISVEAVFEGWRSLVDSKVVAEPRRYGSVPAR